MRLGFQQEKTTYISSQALGVSTIDFFDLYTKFTR